MHHYDERRVQSNDTVGGGEKKTEIVNEKCPPVVVLIYNDTVAGI